MSLEPAPIPAPIPTPAPTPAPLSALTARAPQLGARGRGLAFRSTALILLFGGLIGSLVAWSSALLLERVERDRLTSVLREIMSTVDRTASVAAFARDEQLAKEVVIGLLSNRSIAHAAIEGDGSVLAEAGNASGKASPTDAEQIVRALHSPFDDAEVVGSLKVRPASDTIAREAANYSRLIALILAFEVVAITLGVAWVVTRGVTRPIRTLSDDLHRLDAVGGQHVEPPPGHRQDEIGRLASDVNELIDHMSVALAEERRIRSLHAAAERKWRLIFQNAETGLFTIDREGRLTDWNPWLARTLELPQRDESGAEFLLANRFADADDRFGHMLREAADGRPLQGADFECCDAGGRMRWLHVVLNPLEGAPGMLQGIVNDVTERKRAEAQARAQAARDPLTGLLNRRGLEEAYARLARDERERAGLGVLLIDLDGFKAVNDSHGHEAGDELLMVVARRIETIVRRSDKVARIGGDEFVVLLDTIKSIAVARNIAGKLVDSLGLPFSVLGGVRVSIGASLGVVYTHYPPEQIGELLRRADAAMYEAKKGGKSQYRVAFPA